MRITPSGEVSESDPKRARRAEALRCAAAYVVSGVVISSAAELGVLEAEVQRLKTRLVDREEELAALGHTGALNWIRRFKTPENMAKLGTNGLLWYEMKADTLTDLVMFINFSSWF